MKKIKITTNCNYLYIANKKIIMHCEQPYIRKDCIFNAHSLEPDSCCTCRVLYSKLRSLKYI